MQPVQVISEARAKILWGEPASSVRGFLTANGLTDLEADAVIEDFNAERGNEIRKIGFRKSLLGAALTAGVAVFYCWSRLHIGFEKMEYSDAKGFVMVALVIGLGGLYGLYQLINGIVYLVRPQSESRSLSDIS